jgi:hypothetical protein
LGVNYLANPGFESGSISPWVASTDVAHPNLSWNFTVTSDDTYEGEYAGKIDTYVSETGSGSTFAFYIEQDVLIPAPDPWNISMAWKVTSEGTNPGDNCRLEWDWERTWSIPTDPDTPAMGTWRQSTRNVWSGQQAGMHKFGVYFYCFSWAAGSRFHILFDNIAVVPTD